MLLTPCMYSQSIHQSTNAHNKIQFMNKYVTPTCLRSVMAGIILRSGREVTVHRPIPYHNLIWITYIHLGYMSSQSVCSPWCWTHTLMPLHVLCDIRQSIFAVIVFLPLHGLSLTLPRPNARFSHSSSFALRGGALLNRSQTSTWDMVCPVCCLSCTPHTLPRSAPSIE
jgi:hypothetical protein